MICVLGVIAGFSFVMLPWVLDSRSGEKDVSSMLASRVVLGDYIHGNEAFSEDYPVSPILSGSGIYTLSEEESAGGQFNNGGVSGSVVPAVACGDIGASANEKDLGAHLPDGGSAVLSGDSSLASSLFDDPGGDMVVDPQSLEQSLLIDQTATRTINIANVGADSLDWHIDLGCGTPVSWFSADPVGGSISPGLDDDITITFDSTGVTVGTHTSALCIGSDSSGVEVEIALTVWSRYVWTEQTGANGGLTYGTSVASSDDGSKFVVADRYIYTSVDGGISLTAQRAAGLRNWKSVASSSDGTKLVAAVYGGYIYTSADGGVSWTEQTASGSRNWYSVASSSDGTKLVAAVNGGYIYTSADGGVSWTEQTASGSRTWYSVASSSDGSRLVASAYVGYIYTSADGGVSWTQRTAAGFRIWTNVSLSADGAHIAAMSTSNMIDFDDYIYTSDDGGASWTCRDAAGKRSWRSISSSSSGEKLIAVAGYIYTSDDYGTTWNEHMDGIVGGRWGNIVSSSDGTKLATFSDKGYIYTSVDSGVTWAPKMASGARLWISIASSSDGMNLAAGTYVSFFTSTDGGVSWIEQTAAPKMDWSALSSSSDGQKLIGCRIGNSYMYRSVDGGETWSALSSAGKKGWRGG